MVMRVAMAMIVITMRVTMMMASQDVCKSIHMIISQSFIFTSLFVVLHDINNNTNGSSDTHLKKVRYEPSYYTRC
jgi:hypothetical protein